MTTSPRSFALLVALAALPAAAVAASAVAPLPASTPGLFVHAPYASDMCTPCHASDDAKNPGKVVADMNALCVDCHAEMAPALTAKHGHAAVQDACTNCHNPHNAKVRKLLVEEPGALCAQCHEEVAALATKAAVPHKALTTGAKCLGCHDPHSAPNEKLLRKASGPLCLSCHDREGMKSADGKPLANMKAWIEANKFRHGPVEGDDCSSCHLPHGGPNFRLLTEQYPTNFYAPYDKATYALCVSCHNDAVFTQPKTTLTGFRDGDHNLHFFHVNAGERGRTCRACHEVHASGQEHHIRAAVPFGSKGWLLKLNFTKTADGGSCAKTCHDTRTYARKDPPKKK
jgi:predicted CXXCH cytochrome family protein